MDRKRVYVSFVQAARSGLEPTGVLEVLASSEHRPLRYLRSLFAIYDAEDLAALDLPWWSFRAIDRVERFLDAHPGPRVFEFGSGASTAWLARRAREVHTVEHDGEFLNVVRRLVDGLTNVTLHAVAAEPVDEHRTDVVRSDRAGHRCLDFTRYVHSIDDVGGDFDLIVIDGRARVACLRQSLRHLAPGGLILFDDVERARYAASLQVEGTVPLVLRGLTPCLPFPTSTALIRASA